jgi:hypothetical protein
VEAYIFAITGLSTGTLGIMNDNGSNLPSGTFIDSAGFTPDTVHPGNNPVNLTPNWSLAAGTYWLVAVANGGSDMAWQSQNFPPPSWASGDGVGSAGSWTGAGTQLVPMALIQGTGTVVSPVPLPAALPLFATGLGALGLLGWRRKKKATAA